MIRVMELPPFLKNYFLAFFEVPFAPFFIPALIVSPPYMI